MLPTCCQHVGILECWADTDTKSEQPTALNVANMLGRYCQHCVDTTLFAIVDTLSFLLRQKHRIYTKISTRFCREACAWPSSGPHYNQVWQLDLALSTLLKTYDTVTRHMPQAKCCKLECMVPKNADLVSPDADASPPWGQSCPPTSHKDGHPSGGGGDYGPV